MKKEKKFCPDWVVAALFYNPSGEVLLVEECNDLTIPTGHVDPELDVAVEQKTVDLRATFRREMRDEFIGLGDSAMIGIDYLGEVISQRPDRNVKLIKVLACPLDRETARSLVYKGDEDKGEPIISHRRCIWLRPSEVFFLGSAIDVLARRATIMFSELMKKADFQGEVGYESEAGN